MMKNDDSWSQRIPLVVRKIMVAFVVAASCSLFSVVSMSLNAGSANPDGSMLGGDDMRGILLLAFCILILLLQLVVCMVMVKRYAVRSYGEGRFGPSEIGMLLSIAPAIMLPYGIAHHWITNVETANVMILGNVLIMWFVYMTVFAAFSCTEAYERNMLPHGDAASDMDPMGRQGVRSALSVIGERTTSDWEGSR